MKPIRGAESEGAAGFFKGIGKGLVGSVICRTASRTTAHIIPTDRVFDLLQRGSQTGSRHI